MKDIHKEEGITLVALIITIIVLIILAAVTIIQVVKLDIINVATQGTGNYAEKQEGEKIEFDEMSNFMSNVVEQIGAGKRKQ